MHSCNFLPLILHISSKGDKLYFSLNPAISAKKLMGQDEDKLNLIKSAIKPRQTGDRIINSLLKNIAI